MRVLCYDYASSRMDYNNTDAAGEKRIDRTLFFSVLFPCDNHIAVFVNL